MGSLKKDLNSSNNKVSKIAAILTVVAVLVLVNVSGVLGAFVRTFNNINADGVPNPSQKEYGYGYGDNGWGYGYGFGYGHVPTGGSVGGGSSSNGSSSSNSSSNGDTTNTGTTNTDENTNTGDGSSSNGTIGVKNPDGTVTFCDKVHNPVSFTDIDNSFAENYILFLANRGIVNGYVNATGKFDGTFRPGKKTTRVEFLKMVLRSKCQGKGKDYSSKVFSDIEADTWLARVTNEGIKRGIITSSNSKFRPNDSISRAEALKMLLKSYEIETPEVKTSSFSDVKGWIVKYAEKAKDLEIIAKNSKFRPQDSITREESAKIVVKTMLDVYKKQINK